MNIELVAQMFKNYQSNVLFHLEGKDEMKLGEKTPANAMGRVSNRQFEGPSMSRGCGAGGVGVGCGLFVTEPCLHATV